MAFVYQPLDMGVSGIRLMRPIASQLPHEDIRCEIFQALEYGDDAIEYEALSYTWGDANQTVGIYLNKQPVRIRLNLHNALRALRQPYIDRILWVDAICINQENDVERNHQVGQMRDIYERAERVICWLGMPTPETCMLMEALGRLERECRLYSWSSLLRKKVWTRGFQFQKFYLKPFKAGLIHMLASDWFWRVWIVQEVAFSRRALVQCGEYHVSAQYFAIAPVSLGILPPDHVQAVLDIMPTCPVWQERHHGGISDVTFGS